MTNNPEFSSSPPEDSTNKPESQPLNPLALELQNQLLNLIYAKKPLPPEILAALKELGIDPQSIGSQRKKSPKSPPKI